MLEKLNIHRTHGRQKRTQGNSEKLPYERNSKKKEKKKSATKDRTL